MSGYIGTQPVPQATQTRDSFTCTVGQTSFATSGYTPNFLDVYLNGVKLTATDYTASNGSDVVLASGAATGDVLEVVAFTTFDVVTDTITTAGTALTLDRTGSNGTILDLRKDGSTVGSIGSYAGVVTKIVLDPRTNGASLTGGVNKISPGNQSGALDAHLDLGSTDNRFKDLYLSGGVYLGGTGSANHLDDYEEGTWTATAAGTSSITSPTGHYTKVGNTVFFYWYSRAMTMSSAALSVIGGLPFTAVGGAENYAAILATHNTYAPNSNGGYVTVGSNSIDLITTNTINRDTTPSSGITYLMISGHYQVA